MAGGAAARAAADALGTLRARALVVVRAGLTVGLRPAGAGDAVHPAGVGRDALRVVAAGGVTGGGVALIRGAAGDVRLGTRPGAVAGPLRRVTAPRAALGRADGPRRVLSAGARAVTLAVRRAHRRRQVLAGGMRISPTGSDRGTGPERARDRAAAAGPRTGGGAADPVGAVPVHAVGVGGTGLAVDLLAASPDGASGRNGAGVSGRAIRLAGAVLGAGAARAREVSTAERLGRQTGSEAVAGLGRLARNGVCADRLAAGRVHGIARAAALTVAHAGRSARRGILLGTERVGQAGGRRSARAEQSDLIAGLTGAATGGVAADAVGAMLRVALGVAPAGSAGYLGSAASAQTLDGRDAVPVDGALGLALIGGRAAKEGRTDVDGSRAAGAGTVANAGAGDLGALTGPRGAHRAH
jgi:hypothetical protein